MLGLIVKVGGELKSKTNICSVFHCCYVSGTWINCLQWFRPVDLTNLDHFGGKKLERKVFFVGDRNTKTKTSFLNKLFKDFKIRVVNVEIY